MRKISRRVPSSEAIPWKENQGAASSLETSVSQCKACLTATRERPRRSACRRLYCNSGHQQPVHPQVLRSHLLSRPRNAQILPFFIYGTATSKPGRAQCSVSTPSTDSGRSYAKDKLLNVRSE